MTSTILKRIGLKLRKDKCTKRKLFNYGLTFISLLFSKNLSAGRYLDFVGSDDVVQLVVLQEASGHVGTELAPHPALAGGPPVHRL